MDRIERLSDENKILEKEATAKSMSVREISVNSDSVVFGRNVGRKSDRDEKRIRKDVIECEDRRDPFRKVGKLSFHRRTARKPDRRISSCGPRGIFASLGERYETLERVNLCSRVKTPNSNLSKERHAPNSTPPDSNLPGVTESLHENKAISDCVSQGDQDFLCQICSNVFITKIQAFAHVRFHHWDVLEVCFSTF